MRTRLAACAVTASLLVAACGGGSGGSSASPAPSTSASSQLQALEQSGQIPQLDRSSSLAGPDANTNGVRDDVDAYIAANLSATPEKAAAATQLARGVQSSVVVNAGDIDAVKTAQRQVTRATNCVYSRFTGDTVKPPGKVSRELEAITANTRERLTAYLAYNKALDGTSWSTPEGDTCE